jgi:hypothetical protein
MINNDVIQNILNDNFFVKSFNKIIFDTIINKHLDHKRNINHPKVSHI